MEGVLQSRPFGMRRYQEGTAVLFLISKPWQNHNYLLLHHYIISRSLFLPAQYHPQRSPGSRRCIVRGRQQHSFAGNTWKSGRLQIRNDDNLLPYHFFRRVIALDAGYDHAFLQTVKQRQLITAVWTFWFPLHFSTLHTRMSMRENSSISNFLTDRLHRIGISQRYLLLLRFFRRRLFFYQRLFFFFRHGCGEIQRGSHISRGSMA